MITLALWLLRHACFGRDTEALTGDLLEQLHEGRSHAWLWKQVFVAIAVGILLESRRRWPAFAYAIAALSFPTFTWKLAGYFVIPQWYKLPWPWSELVRDLSGWSAFVLVPLAVLAISLRINGNFRWMSLLRTIALTLVPLAIWQYLPDVFPFLMHQVDSQHQEMIIPQPVMMVLFFSFFLVPACIGCAPWRVTRRTRPAKM